MLDIKFIRDNLELCKNAAKNKNRVVEWEKLLQLDDRRRELIRQVETLRAERNEISSQSAVSAKGRSAFGGRSSQLRGKEIKGELKKLEEELRTVEQEFTQLMYTVPNVPDKSVPVGKDSTGNVEIKKWGEPTKFSFKPKDHIQLAKELDLIDFERGVKVGGYRAYFLKNEAALLEMAILMYAYQKLVKKGYIPLIAPSILNEFTLFGIGQFPWGREEVYHLEKDDKYLAGTAEQPVTAYFANEILNEKDLPKKFVAFSPCFRREAGSYGKDTKGAYRVHQFNKIEQVIISTNDMSKSFELHEELLRNSEEILQDLKLPYRVLLMCTGDMGEPQVKKYDVETWMPSRVAYGETMSNSVMGDFQTRRLKIRYRTKDGQTLFCHSLNNTAIASPRILIPILENYQNSDGSVTIPEVLRLYLGKDKISR
ncbi:MAG: Serine-tRNA ligase [Candidatus Gottesmanbacteria bacterium GW2011_GWB1_43_11]|uniref:Serine--tRNA ligase n=2 Tax=Candidatus Gottesmaniibacteriota TaxID=1752720 RepID=A0A0G1HHJ6_9BACT|nr:MAG: Serine-tRNA ligase [Candidatus Gottesmanbacteria bacterium GW2011_GWC1_43_10]KKS87326.1 MAG: Serine-tRNA ligase [Candidatus Gottesmanbacteria bacterium GW2011_GWB1_43_11]KKT46721.1 MAG: Serine-tRNA ligase [Candidatus Gottesmanbacteria bacterium GW2011_GWA2_44_17]HCM37850.1 serine--tRNA ligase [Patescibacteria group bacterium]